MAGKEKRDPLSVTATVRRKREDLPAYVVVPADAVGRWALAGTTVVLVSIDGAEPVRRTLKRWDEERWFMDLTGPILTSAGIEIGGKVELTIALASTELPIELRTILDSDPGASARWDAMTASRKRSLREHVLSAARPETRQRRAEQALCGP